MARSDEGDLGCWGSEVGGTVLDALHWASHREPVWSVNLSCWAKTVYVQ